MFLNLLFVMMLLLVGSAKLAYSSEMCTTITDYGRLPLPSALVSARELGTGKFYASKTNSSGLACFLNLPEGAYAVEVGLQGFMNVRCYPVKVRPEAKTNLSFWLPLGEVNEGSLSEDVTLIGILRQNDTPLSIAKICLLTFDRVLVSCTATNGLGEYTIALPPGAYEVEIQTSDKRTFRSKVSLTTPGTYRNVIAPIDTGPPR